MSKEDAGALLSPATVVAEARKAETAPGHGVQPSGNPSHIETGTIAAVPGPMSAPTNGAAGTARASGDAELFIDFEPGAVTLPDRSRRSIRETVAARVLGGAKQLRIVAARGGTGNLFDQAVIAQKRARAVKDMLPVRMVASVDFDPTIPEDTVIIEFKGDPGTSRVP